MNDETLVREIDGRRRQAMVDADTATLARLIDDHVVWIHGSARIDDKTRLLDGIAAGAADYRAINVTEERYRQLGPDTLLVTCVTHMDVVLDGSPRDPLVRNVLVWNRTEAGWKLVSYQSTALRVA